REDRHRARALARTDDRPGRHGRPLPRVGQPGPAAVPRPGPARRAPPAGAPRGLCRGDALLPRRLARASRGPRRLRHRVPAPPASRADAGAAALEADALPARARVAPAGLAARWGGGAMKAAVMRAIGEPLRIEELRLDAPAPREVVVRTAATGVCHSDLHV